MLEHVPSIEEAEGWSIEEDRDCYLRHQLSSTIGDIVELLREEFLSLRAIGSARHPCAQDHIRAGLKARLNLELYQYGLSAQVRRGYGPKGRKL